MQFLVKRWPVAGEQGWALLWLDDRLDTVCCLAVPRDTITHWRGAWLALSAGDATQLDRPVAQAKDLFQLDVLDCSLTEIRALYGLVELLQTGPTGASPDLDAGAGAIREFLAERFDFRSGQDGSNRTQIVIEGHVYPALGTDPTWAESWLAAFFKWAGAQSAEAGPADFVQGAVECYEFLYAAARQHRDGGILSSFVAFSRALAERLERDDRYHPYRRRLDDVYETIACHECDLDVARDGLLRLLTAPGSMASKWPRLSNFIHRLKSTDNWREGAAQANDEHVATLTGLIADRYLENYDLDRAVAAWRQLSLRDPLLGMLLALMHRPGGALLLHGAAFLSLTVLALVQSGMSRPLYVGLPVVGPLSLVPALGGLLLLLLFVGPAWVGVRVVYNLLRRRLYYAQLVLPRMLAAIVVGLSVLMLDDFPWRLSLRLPLSVLILVAGGVYFFSYLYILLDVYQTIRFEPVPSPSQPSTTGSTLGYATQVALRVFAIGIVQSFLPTLLITGLLLPIVFQDTAAGGAYPWEGSPLGWIAFRGGAGSAAFVFVPALVLLWTGMALFIGAFVQLLWQDRRVISPVRG